MELSNLPLGLQDSRKKKVIFLSHCILNENVRYLGGAFRGGCLSEIVEQCIQNDIGMIQMPCPEQMAWGGVLKKWMLKVLQNRRWFIRPVRVLLFALFLMQTRRVYRKLARDVANQIEDYLASGFEVIGIIGIDGSPSCGVEQVLDLHQVLVDLITVETLNRQQLNNLVKMNVVKGMGLFTEQLQKILRRRHISVPYIAHDLLAEMEGKQSNVIISLLKKD